jgi:hypothetical protein
MKWNYRRLDGVSKWTAQNKHWVTKYDLEATCHVGINGKPVKSWFIEDPGKAREAVEEFLDHRREPPEYKQLRLNEQP